MNKKCEICGKLFENDKKLVLIFNPRTEQHKAFCQNCLYNIAKDGNRQAIHAAILKMLTGEE